MHEITLDLETKKAFSDVGGKTEALEVSLVGLHSTRDGLISYEEHELASLWPLLESADLIIGFNIKHFDYRVLEPYYLGHIHKLPTLDIMEEITNFLGHRAKLDDVARLTLGRGKSGHGLEAIEFYRKGEMDKLKKYCLDDVSITREVYEYGIENGKILAPSSGRTVEVPVNWAKKQKKEVNLTLPF